MQHEACPDLVDRAGTCCGADLEQLEQNRTAAGAEGDDNG